MSNVPLDDEGPGYSELRDYIQQSNEIRIKAEEEARMKVEKDARILAEEQARLKLAKEKIISDFILVNFGESIRKKILNGARSGSIVLQDSCLGFEMTHADRFSISGKTYEYKMLKDVMTASGLDVNEINHAHSCHLCHPNVCGDRKFPYPCGSIIFPSDDNFGNFQSDNEYFVIHLSSAHPPDVYSTPLENMLKSGLEPYDFSYLFDRHYAGIWDRIFEYHFRDNLLSESELKSRLSSWESARIMCQECFLKGERVNDCISISTGFSNSCPNRVKSLQICYNVII